jgi:hypothetical protein
MASSIVSSFFPCYHYAITTSKVASELLYTQQPQVLPINHQENTQPHQQMLETNLTMTKLSCPQLRYPPIPNNARYLGSVGRGVLHPVLQEA